MTRCKIHICAITSLLAFALLGCASSKKLQTARVNLNSEQLVEAARDAAYSSIKTSKRAEAKAAAESGMEYSERCIAAAPDEPGCYYWRAVNTGLYYKIHVIGYQRGVKKMIADCQKVISKDPNYDHAGAYRMLGEIFTQLPATGGAADSIVRDLPKAEEYLRKAVQIADDYPENHIALAATLLAEDKFEESIAALTNARKLAPKWKHDVSYNDWSDTMLALEKKVGRNKK